MSLYYTLLSETTPRARKQYSCIWCGESIPVGERHVHSVSCYDGLQDQRWHADCHKVAQNDFDWCENGGEFNPWSHQRGSLREHGEKA